MHNIHPELTKARGRRVATFYGLTDILRFDGRTGDFVDTFVGTGSGGLNHPYRIVFGPDGNLYVSNLLPNDATGNVLRYNGTSGAFIDAFASSSLLGVPLDLTFGPDGNLYVASGASGPVAPQVPSSSVLRFNGTTGQFISTFVSLGTGLPFALTFGPDGNLYVGGPLCTYHCVKRFDGRTGSFMDIFVQPFSGGLGSVASINFGPPPVITDITPTSGPVGTCVTITGRNFGSTRGTSSVRFGGTEAVVTSWNDNQINVPSPLVQQNTVPVAVVTFAGASNAKDFTYVRAQVAITAPREFTNFFISPEPRMPLINASATITNAADPGCFTYRWNYRIDYTVSVRDVNGAVVFRTDILSNQGDDVPGGQWIPNFGSDFAGGNLSISVFVANTSNSRPSLKIYGLNPDKEAVKSFLFPLPDPRFTPGFNQVIAYLETHTITGRGEFQTWHQFDTSTGSADNPTSGLPLQSSDRIGYGIMQLTDPAPVRDEIWTWVRNVEGGKRLIQEKYKAARRHLDQHPPYSVEILELETWQRYNGGVYWEWNGTVWVPSTRFRHDYAKKAQKLADQISRGQLPPGW